MGKKNLKLKNSHYQSKTKSVMSTPITQVQKIPTQAIRKVQQMMRLVYQDKQLNTLNPSISTPCATYAQGDSSKTNIAI